MWNFCKGKHRRNIQSEYVNMHLRALCIADDFSFPQSISKQNLLAISTPSKSC